MYVVSDIASLRKQTSEWVRQGQRIALVPTMGNLHEGHFQLVSRAQSLAIHTVVSLFVNPMQFDRKDDLDTYPRTFEEDRQALEDMHVDMLFYPGSSVIYPHALESMTRVEVPGLSDILCGVKRPGHFTGVATVVTKLLNLVTPDIAVFGEKDYQQLLVIKKLVADLDINVEIHSVATVREKDGLAMSSRNRHLSQGERLVAPSFYRVLREVVSNIQTGSRQYSDLETSARHVLRLSGFRPDYVNIVDSQTLGLPDDYTIEVAVLAAVWLGNTRLIDNIIVKL